MIFKTPLIYVSMFPKFIFWYEVVSKIFCYVWDVFISNIILYQVFFALQRISCSSELNVLQAHWHIDANAVPGSPVTVFTYETWLNMPNEKPDNLSFLLSIILVRDFEVRQSEYKCFISKVKLAHVYLTVSL